MRAWHSLTAKFRRADRCRLEIWQELRIAVRTLRNASERGSEEEWRGLRAKARCLVSEVRIRKEEAA